MGLFVVIACAFLVAAVLEVLAFRRRNELEAEGLVTVVRPETSTYLNPPRPY
ncbi:hypothetical protein [Methylobacterium gregans]|uniref:Uncharacterized protein n=1 Tax=Methylobacterium gregans TaxID=374424 RepID=A0AA37MHY2_9HYPH|nr:hypothetical protein [Methylobacterium gregans]MDQ0521175.1 hypothetical protein [Methylobacterium gregans]GJD81601.1 hypothetical protein NBEOAGPD_4855 [Methylobacterium gregans]GLS54341.1 hypothetical protein GCM10007886_25240 [Methylobacterium gregans]